MWNDLKNAEEDLELWREYDKGAQEALERAEEAKEWVDQAQESFDHEDGLRLEREAEAARIEAERLEQEAYAQRVADMEAAAEAAAALQGEVDGINTEITTTQELYDAMDADGKASAEGLAHLESIEGFNTTLGEKQGELDAAIALRDELIEAKRAEDAANLQAMLDAAEAAFNYAEENLPRLEEEYNAFQE